MIFLKKVLTSISLCATLSITAKQDIRSVIINNRKYQNGLNWMTSNTFSDKDSTTPQNTRNPIDPISHMDITNLPDQWSIMKRSGSYYPAILLYPQYLFPMENEKTLKTDTVPISKSHNVNLDQTKKKEQDLSNHHHFYHPQKARNQVGQRKFQLSRLTYNKIDPETWVPSTEYAPKTNRHQDTDNTYYVHKKTIGEYLVGNIAETKIGYETHLGHVNTPVVIRNKQMFSPKEEHFKNEGHNEIKPVLNITEHNEFKKTISDEIVHKYLDEFLRKEEVVIVGAAIAQKQSAEDQHQNQHLQYPMTNHHPIPGNFDVTNEASVQRPPKKSRYNTEPQKQRNRNSREILADMEDERKSNHVDCDVNTMRKYSCFDCYSYLKCKVSAGKIKNCKNPLAPYCNDGACSSEPSKECEALIK